jgi:N-acetylmuramoyl-L-alanine amidase
MTTVMRTILKLLLSAFLLLPALSLSAEKGMTIKNARYFSYASFTRIVFEVDAAAPYVVTRAADNSGLILTAYEAPLFVKTQLPVIKDGVVNGLETRDDAGRTAIFVRLEAAAGAAKDFALRAPDRIVLDIARGTAPAPVQPVDKPLAVVVLDPGHGGRDTGLITPKGPEKMFTLDMALAVKKILQKNPLLKVVLTRDKDQALSPDDRAAASNAAGALLFVSIHGQAGATARVYIQDVLDDSPASAPRSASGDFIGFESGSELQELVWGRQQSSHARESGGFGRRLAGRLTGDGAEPLQAPLTGLKAVDAAAALVELGMAGDRIKSAEALAWGIEQYVKQIR